MSARPPGIIAYRAAWTWSGPGDLRAGQWLVVEQGRVRELTDRPPAEARRIDLGDGLLLPGLVNAHTHLELSFLHGLAPEPARDFVGWLEGLVRVRPGHDHLDATEATRRAVRQAREAGTVLAGDITNTFRAQEPAWEEGLHTVSFGEAIGPKRAQPPEPSLAWREGVLQVSAVAAHAPYSVPDWRLQALKRQAGRLPFCIHLAESQAEVEFVAGQGEQGQRLRQFLLDRGMNLDDLVFHGPRPLAHLLALGVVDSRSLLVHGVQLTPGELGQVAAAGASLCVCPRSNLGLTGAIAPLEAALAAGVNLCLGTDSLTSAPDLSLWPEMATLRRLFPDLPPESVLTMATLGGAQALGLAAHFGSLWPGRLAQAVFRALPGGLAREAVFDQALELPEPGQVQALDLRGQA